MTCAKIQRFALMTQSLPFSIMFVAREGRKKEQAMEEAGDLAVYREVSGCPPPPPHPYLLSLLQVPQFAPIV